MIFSRPKPSPKYVIASDLSAPIRRFPNHSPVGMGVEAGMWKLFTKNISKGVAKFLKWVTKGGRPKQGDQRSELTVASDNITRGYFFPLKLEFFARFGFNWLGKT